MADLISVRDAVEQLLDRLGVVASYDITVGRDRATGYVGKPRLNPEATLTMTIQPRLPALPRGMPAHRWDDHPDA